MNVPLLLTTAEAAAFAGVTASTIKRWADTGLLPCVRTAGGHRRIERHALEHMLHTLSSSQQPEDDPYWHWIDTLLTGHRHSIDALLLETRAHQGSWAAVADETGRMLSALGRFWVLGKISIAQEHAASESLSRALIRMADALPSPMHNHTCVLATPENDPHTLGLFLAELCLREATWIPRFIGPLTPLQELLRIARQTPPTMIALSASSVSNNAQQLLQFTQELACACQEHGVTLALGGSGAWPANHPHTVRFSSYTDFQKHLLSYPPYTPTHFSFSSNT
jgi:excisionase family DNA binding protein